MTGGWGGEPRLDPEGSPSPAPVDVLYLDDALVAVQKPAGMIVHRGSANDDVVVMKVVRDMLGRWVYPVHRLDRPTSGVLVLALAPEHAAALNRAFEERRVDKGYLALVRGIPPASGIIDHPVPCREDGPRVPARTDYQVVGTFERFALVRAHPHTGRFHQIRRHFKHLSHPLVGDVRYGKGEINRMFRERFGLHRLALHASSLRLPHPVTGAPLHLSAPVPADLAGPLAAMGLLEGASRPPPVPGSPAGTPS